MSSDLPYQSRKSKGHQRLRDGLLGVFDRAGYSVTQTAPNNMLRPDAIATLSSTTDPASVFTNAEAAPEALKHGGEIALTAVSEDQALFETPILRIFKNAVNTRKKCVFATTPSDEDEIAQRSAEAVRNLFTGQWIADPVLLGEGGKYEPNNTDVVSSCEIKEMDEKVGIHQYINEYKYSYYSTLDRMVFDGGETTAIIPLLSVGQWFRSNTGGVVYTLVSDNLEDEDYTLSDLQAPYGDLSVGDTIIEFADLESFIRNDPEYVYAKRTRYSDDEDGYTLIKADGTRIENMAWEDPHEAIWESVYRPFIPAVEFNREPSADDWCVLQTDSVESVEFKLSK